MQTRHKRLAGEGPSTPHGAERPAAALCAPLLTLPSDLECLILRQLEYQDLSRLACTCSSLAAATEDCGLWRREWERMYGEVGALQEAAAARAGSWKRLFESRHAALKAADPWLKPSGFEVEASVESLVALPATSQVQGKQEQEVATAAGSAAIPPPPPPAMEAVAAGPVPAAAPEGGGPAEEIVPAPAEEEGEGQGEAELCLVFLVDGSGSVTEEDFRVMTDFMLAAVRQLAAAPHGPRSRVAVVQFSNDVRVEQGPVGVDPETFEALMGNMHRMNGGTNIALAVRKAGQLLKPLGPRTHRVLALLTDGRIDSHQSREAADMASRLGDEQACVRLHAYGVGRGVDREELLRIIGGREPKTAADRYLGLMVLDEAPW